MNDSSAHTPVIGVVGLGSMGFGAAVSAHRRGFVTWGTDPRPEARARFAAEGGRVTASLPELAAACDVVVVLVVNAAQTEAVLFGSDGLAGPPAARQRGRGLGHGRPGAAAAMGSAPGRTRPAPDRRPGLRRCEEGRRRADDGDGLGPARGLCRRGRALDAIAGKVYRLGDQAGPGSTVKMVNQLLAGVHIATACEAMALGIRAGADPHQLYEVICNSAGNSWMFQNRMQHVLDGDYTPLSAVNIFIKDLGIVLDAARALKFPLPLAAQAHQLYLATAAAGHGDEDDSAVIKHYAALAGLDAACREGWGMNPIRIADDFTGATDLANMLVRAGMRTVQTIGVPEGRAARRGRRGGGGAEVAHHPGGRRGGAVAGGAALAAGAGARQIYFKYCSTFDSTPPATSARWPRRCWMRWRAGLHHRLPGLPGERPHGLRGHLFVGDLLLSATAACATTR
jgi:L-threonate 2-dehydrogenase